jgi:hypothetical protein
MATPLLGVLAALMLFSSPAGGTELDDRSRVYTHKSLGTEFCTNITLKGSLLHIAKFKHWLNQIEKVPHGRTTLQAIVESGHQLTIAHSNFARFSAGRTQAPMSQNLINGQGEPVTILLDATISERGSHMVFNGKREPIEYTAVENLFHELAHARHKMNGTWRYFDSESQAIEEENTFRRQLALMNGSPVTERAWKTGIPIESVAGIVLEMPMQVYRIRSNPPVSYYSDNSSLPGRMVESLP